MKKLAKNNKGFSLVELIVVIAIMAVLVGVLAPQLIKYVEKSRQATDIQNCDSIATTLKTYFSDKEGLADTIVVTVTNTGATSTDAGATQALSDAGLTGTKLKGAEWSGDKITITYTSATGKISYQAESDNYSTGGGAQSSEEIGPKKATAGGNGGNGGNGAAAGDNS